MILSYFFICIFSCFSVDIFCAEPSFLLTFDQLQVDLNIQTPAGAALKHLDNKPVYIRGFLYQNQEGESVLAPQPNLQSCCVGTQSKVYQQIFIQGHLPSYHQAYAVTIEGLFKISPTYNQQGQLTRFYILDQVHVKSQTDQSLFEINPIILICLSVGIIFIFFKRKFLRKGLNLDSYQKKNSNLAL